MSDDYAKVRAILDAATPGPWTTFGGYDGFRTIATTADSTRQWSVALPAATSRVPGFMRDPEADARAIVVARNLAPELLAVAEAAERVAGDMRAGYDVGIGATGGLFRALDALHAKMKETLT